MALALTGPSSLSPCTVAAIVHDFWGTPLPAPRTPGRAHHIMNMCRGNGFFQDWWSDFAIPVPMSLNRPSNSRKPILEGSHASNAEARQFVDCTCRGFCLSPSQTIPTVLENTRDGPDNPATIRPYSLYHLQYGTKSIRTGSVLISQSYFSKSSVRIVIGCIWWVRTDHVRILLDTVLYLLVLPPMLSPPGS